MAFLGSKMANCASPNRCPEPDFRPMASLARRFFTECIRLGVVWYFAWMAKAAARGKLGKADQ
jgi:hypothetical protein